MEMRKDLINLNPLQSSFLSCSNDTELILKKLFVESEPYSDVLKRLLIINKPDCLDKDIPIYQELVDNISLGELISKGYIRLNPKISRPQPQENFINQGASESQDDDGVCQTPQYDAAAAKRLDSAAIKSYIIMSFDNFTPTTNPEYLDCTINFDVVCYTDEWCLDNYKIRPLMICGYIDGILKILSNKNRSIYKSNQNIKLTGIGEYQLLGCNETVLNEDISMYTLAYRGVHFTEDKGQITNE